MRRICIEKIIAIKIQTNSQERSDYLVFIVAVLSYENLSSLYRFQRSVYNCIYYEENYRRILTEIIFSSDDKYSKYICLSCILRRKSFYIERYEIFYYSILLHYLWEGKWVISYKNGWDGVANFQWFSSWMFSNKLKFIFRGWKMY